MRIGIRAAVLLVALGCAGDSGMSYSVATDWRGEPDSELLERYPEFFRVIYNDSDTRDPDLRPLRRDMEHVPVDRWNYGALRAVAIAYFELNFRAETNRGDGLYLGNSFRAAHLVAIPWKAYGQVDDGPLRDAILDFFEDVGSGDKQQSGGTAHRLAGIVESLEGKETDPARIARIRRITGELRGP